MQNSCELRLVIGKMKRLLAICVCFFMCVGLCSCDSSQTRSVSSYNWSLEFITDLDGNMSVSYTHLVSGKRKAGSKGKSRCKRQDERYDGKGKAKKRTGQFTAAG